MSGERTSVVRRTDTTGPTLGRSLSAGRTSKVRSADWRTPCGTATTRRATGDALRCVAPVDKSVLGLGYSQPILGLSVRFPWPDAVSWIGCE